MELTLYPNPRTAYTILKEALLLEISGVEVKCELKKTICEIIQEYLESVQIGKLWILTRSWSWVCLD